MPLFKRVHNDARLGLQEGRIEEVEVVAKECDAVGKRREQMGGPDSLLRDHQDSSKRRGDPNFGQKFPPYSRLADWSNGPINSVHTLEVRHRSKFLKRSNEFVSI